MKTLIITLILLIFPAGLSIAMPLEKTTELAPLWQAIRSFDQTIQGPIVVNIRKGNVSGFIGDHQTNATLKDSRFILDFGVKVGRFHGELSGDGNQLEGHWVQGPTGQFLFTPYATPIRFKKQPHGFVGKVEPLHDRMTLYMLLGEQTEQGYQIQFINPESNRGRFFKAAALKIEGDKAILFGQLRWHKKPQVLATGGFDKQNATISLYMPIFGGSYDFTVADKDSHYWPKAPDVQYRYRQPNITTVGTGQWLVSNAKSEGVDESKLTKLVQSIIDNPPKHPNDGAVHAVLVARNGKLILEEYFNGIDSHTLHDTRSASKSLTGTLVGMAQHAGVPIKLEDRLYQSMSVNYPNLTSEGLKAAITLQDVLSMSTGLDCDDNNSDSPGNEDTMQSQQAQPDWFRYMLDLEMVGKPGATTAYCSGGISLAGGMLAQKAGMWLPSIIERYFAKPLGIKTYHVNLMANGKEAYSGGGMRLRARDFLKLGQLMLDNGRWQGKQLIDPDYAKLAVSPLKGMFGQKYGLGWWLKDFEVDGKTKTVFYAGGNGGQQIIADPQTGLVAVFFGGAYSTKGTYYARDTLTPRYLLNAVIE